MKKYLSLFLFVFTAHADPLARPAFDLAKVPPSPDVFGFYRATADYFYALSSLNRDRLAAVQAFANVTGWCAGDAHPDNFGALVLADGDVTFSLNDMDDAGPCPLVMDLERFLVGAEMSGGTVTELLPAYLAGTREEVRPVPHAIYKLLKKSAERGARPDPDDLEGDRLARRKQAREIGPAENHRVRTAVGADPVDVYATAKCGGGSHGLLRYEVLLASPTRVLELKTLAAPAVAAVTTELPAQAERIARTLEFEQEGRASALYRVVEVDGRPMLQRPRFDGDKGVKIAELAPADRAEVLSFEAYRLGRLHALSKRDWASALDARALAADVDALKNHLETVYKETDFKPDRSCRSDRNPTK